MPEIIREQLISNIVDAVGGVYGLEAPSNERQVPLTIVREFDDQPGDEDFDVNNLVMPVFVGRAVLATSADREVRRKQGHVLISELFCELYADETFSGLADGIDFAGQAVDLEMPKIVMAVVQFDVRYHHLRGDPLTID